MAGGVGVQSPSLTSGAGSKLFCPSEPVTSSFSKGEHTHPTLLAGLFGGFKMRCRKTLKCQMRTLFLPEKEGVCLRNNYHYQPQHMAVPEEILKRAEHSSSVSLLISFILTWWAMVPILSQSGSHYFHEEMNAIFFALCMPDVGSKLCAM